MYVDGWNSSGLVTLGQSSPNLYHSAYILLQIAENKIKEKKEMINKKEVEIRKKMVIKKKKENK